MCPLFSRVETRKGAPAVHGSINCALYTPVTAANAAGKSERLCSARRSVTLSAILHIRSQTKDAFALASIHLNTTTLFSSLRRSATKSAQCRGTFCLVAVSMLRETRCPQCATSAESHFQGLVSLEAHRVCCSSCGISKWSFFFFEIKPLITFTVTLIC